MTPGPGHLHPRAPGSSPPPALALQLYLPRLQGVVQPQPPDVGVSACGQRRDQAAVTGQLVAVRPEVGGFPRAQGKEGRTRHMLTQREDRPGLTRCVSWDG